MKDEIVCNKEEEFSQELLILFLIIHIDSLSIYYAEMQILVKIAGTQYIILKYQEIIISYFASNNILVWNKLD